MNPISYSWGGLRDCWGRLARYRSRDRNIIEHMVWERSTWGLIVFAAILCFLARLLTSWVSRELSVGILNAPMGSRTWEWWCLTALNYLGLDSLLIMIVFGARIRRVLGGKIYTEAITTSPIDRSDIWYSIYTRGLVILCAVYFINQVGIVAESLIKSGFVYSAAAYSYPIEITGTVEQQPGRYLFAFLWLIVFGIFLPLFAPTILSFIELNLVIRTRRLFKGVLVAWIGGTVVWQGIMLIEMPFSYWFSRTDYYAAARFIIYAIHVLLYVFAFGLVWTWFRRFFAYRPTSLEKNHEHIAE